MQALGQLESDRIELVAEFSEVITAIEVIEGDVIAPGAIVVRQDSDRVDIRIEEARASIRRIEAILAEQISGPRVETIDAARANLSAAQIERSYRERELSRLMGLRERSLTSAESVDSAQNLLNAAQARIELVSAQLAELQAGTRTEQIDQTNAQLAQARAQLAAVSAQAELARQQVARYRPLAESGAEPREKLEQFQTQAREAEAQVAAARAAVLASERRQGSLGQQIGQSSAQANAARAQLEAARLNLASTTLNASIAGRIGDLTVRPGQFVQPGQRLMSIVPTDQLYVTANFKETQLALMRPGQPVTLKVDALPDVTIAGRVDSIAPGTGAEFSILPPQNATGNFTKIVQRVPVRIAIEAGPEVKRLLVAGMSVVATVDTRSAKDELAAARAPARR